MAEKVVRKPAARKTAARVSERKAPPREMESGSDGRRSKAVLIALAAFVVFVGMSLAIGFSDSGQINVSGTFNEVRTSGTEEERNLLQDVPVQRGRNELPDGGLVPTTDVDPRALTPEPETATTTASSTDETASSTEPVTVESAAETNEEVAGESASSDAGAAE